MLLLITTNTKPDFKPRQMWYMFPFLHLSTKLLQHSSSKDRYNNHTQHTQPGLVNSRHHNARRRTGASTSSRAACPTRRRASASSRRTRRRRRVVAVTEDSSRRNAIVHEAALQVRHGLLDRQAVVAAVAVERFDGSGLAALLEDVGCVAGEIRGGAADGTGNVLCGELGVLIWL